jgi:hypothetical protein
MEDQPSPHPGRVPDVRVRVNAECVSYRLRVATLRGATTHLVVRCAPDGTLYAAIEHVLADTQTP